VTSAAATPSGGLQARTRTAQPRSARSFEAVSTNCSTPPACGRTKLETISTRPARGAGARSRCRRGAGTALLGAGTRVGTARAIARSAPPAQQRPPCGVACARTRLRGKRCTRGRARARAVVAAWHRRLISPAVRDLGHHAHRSAERSGGGYSVVSTLAAHVSDSLCIPGIGRRVGTN
jgi:hypothetical protein